MQLPIRHLSKIKRGFFIALAILPLTIFDNMAWGACSSGSPPFGTEHCAHPGFMPQIMWTRGCTPTSAAMVLGYWDIYDSSVGYFSGSGRMIDYWQDESRYVNNMACTNGVPDPNLPDYTIDNVPNVLEELRVAIGTDACGVSQTNQIGPGITHVTNAINGYCYTSSQCIGTRRNDHCFSAITNEIYYLRPFVWSVGVSGQVGHTLAGWGYTDQKFIMTYNTWNYGTDYWFYTKYDNGPTTDWQYVDTVVPGCRQGTTELLLIQPQARQTLVGYSNFTISWLQWPGTDIKTVDLMLSTDGGATWAYIARNIQAISGWNYFNWSVPPVNSATARVRALGFDVNGNYLGGDGSGSSRSNFTNIGDFTISYSPPPPDEE